MKVFNIDINNHDQYDNLIKSNNSFIKFYSPSCFHCNQMLNDWKQLENQVLKENKLA